MLLSHALFMVVISSVGQQPSAEFLEKHCLDCHSAEARKGGLDLAQLKLDPSKSENFAKWVKVYDRIGSGEMPPKECDRPSAAERSAMSNWIKSALVKAELDRLGAEPRSGLRRLTRTEYENTMRDLFDMPGIVLRDDLPADGSAHGFDTNADALEISHVNIAKYMEIADRVLDLAIATQPTPPTRKIHRVSVACESSTLGACIGLPKAH